MDRKYCESCNEKLAQLKRAKNGKRACKDCFFTEFEEEIYQTMLSEGHFEQGDKIALAISGGKDSTVLVEVMTTLKKRHQLQVDFELLAIDEGIKGYRDDSLETVKRNQKNYDLPLTILSYQDLFGRTMDQVVSLTSVKTSCTYCGVFRRNALNNGAFKLKSDRLFTGHNADDMAETVLMNFLRGDAYRLCLCTQSVSGEETDLKRCKPFKFAYEKEIVLYAHFKKLDYFSTECTYSKDAFRGPLKDLMKHMSELRPGIIEDII